jgi:hypothetical protein
MPAGGGACALGNRRALECPSCSCLYAADMFHLIRAGVTGGKNAPDPSLPPTACGVVHAQGVDDKGSAGLLGQPLCADCYDHASHAVWQWFAPDLWRGFTNALHRALAHHLGISAGGLPKWRPCSTPRSRSSDVAALSISMPSSDLRFPPRIVESFS